MYHNTECKLTNKEVYVQVGREQENFVYKHHKDMYIVSQFVRFAVSQIFHICLHSKFSDCFLSIAFNIRLIYNEKNMSDLFKLNLLMLENDGSALRFWERFQQYFNILRYIYQTCVEELL